MNEAIDEYDFHVQTGETNERALHFALRNNGISPELLAHHLREIKSGIPEKNLKNATRFVTGSFIASQHKAHLGLSNKFFHNQEPRADAVMLMEDDWDACMPDYASFFTLRSILIDQIMDALWP